VTAIPTIAAWPYDSGKGWRMTMRSYLTSQGYVISMVGDVKMPADRLQWPVASKYVAKVLDKLKSKTVKTSLLRPANDVRQDEVVLGPVTIFDRIVPLVNGKAILDFCEPRLATYPGQSVCQLSFLNSANNEVSLSTFSQQSSGKHAGGDSFRIKMDSAQGWQGGGSFSSANLRLEYVGELKNYKQFRDLYPIAVKTGGIDNFQFRLQRVGSRPLRTKLFYEKAVGSARMVYREFDLDKSRCWAAWSVSNGRGVCQLPLPFRGLRLGESSFLFQKILTLGRDGIYVSISADHGSYTVEVYGNETLLRDQRRMFAFFDEVTNLLANGLFRDLAMTYPQS
jgi:hypothetical protein